MPIGLLNPFRNKASFVESSLSGSSAKKPPVDSSAVDISDNSARASLERLSEAVPFEPKSELDLQMNLDILKKYILEALKNKSLKENTFWNRLSRSSSNPALIEGFEKILVQELVPLQLKLKSQLHSMKIPLEEEVHGKSIKFNQEKYKLDKEPPETDRNDFPNDKSLWDWRYEFFSSDEYEKGSKKRLPDFKFIEETSPIAETLYDDRNLFPVRRVVLNFKNPENEKEIIKIQYNAGPWLCGKVNCIRGLDVSFLEPNSSGDLVKKRELVALDPARNKRRSWIASKIFRMSPIQAPDSLKRGTPITALEDKTISA